MRASNFRHHQWIDLSAPILVIPEAVLNSLLEATQFQALEVHPNSGTVHSDYFQTMIELKGYGVRSPEQFLLAVSYHRKISSVSWKAPDISIFHHPQVEHWYFNYLLTDKLLIQQIGRAHV